MDHVEKLIREWMKQQEIDERKRKEATQGTKPAEAPKTGNGKGPAPTTPGK